MASRAERRHHVERLKENRKNYWGYGVYSGRFNTREKDMGPRQLGKVVQHPAMCSCSGCGNPRRHEWFKGERLTLQERSFNEVTKKYEDGINYVRVQDPHGEDA